MTVEDLLRRIFTTRYARALEDEIARMEGEIARAQLESDRLRDENRALLNSILGIAGIPPVILTDSGETRPQASGSQERPRKATSAAPVRRRSWHQVTQSLELASLRRSQSEHAGTGSE